MKITEVMITLKQVIESINNKTKEEMIIMHEIDIILYHILNYKCIKTSISDSFVGKLKIFSDDKDKLRMYGAKYIVHLLAIEFGYNLNGFDSEYQTNKYVS